MIHHIVNSDLFLLTLTVGFYCAGTAIFRRTKVMILHPALLTFAAIIAMLKWFGVEYEQYREATGILDFALGLSVVALGYLMHEQTDRIRGRMLPIAVSTVVGCLVGIFSVVYIALAFGAEREIVTSIAPKSVTVPIAVAVSEPLGGIVAVTSVVVFCVGIFGSVCGDWILSRCGITDKMAKGFALGSAAHGIGTARAIELGAIEGAMSGLAMALMGIVTAVVLPIIENYLY